MDSLLLEDLKDSVMEEHHEKKNPCPKSQDWIDGTQSNNMQEEMLFWFPQKKCIFPAFITNG